MDRERVNKLTVSIQYLVYISILLVVLFLYSWKHDAGSGLCSCADIWETQLFVVAKTIPEVLVVSYCMLYALFASLYLSIYMKKKRCMKINIQLVAERESK